MLSRFLFLFSFSFSLSIAQTIQKIHLKKDAAAFYFFQKGKASDTIFIGKTDVFYLLLSDSLKEKLNIETKNAQLLAEKNDSLVLLKYMPGINYLHKFLPQENDLIQLEIKQNRKNKLQIVPLIDGANEIKSNKIEILFIDKTSKNIFAEFIYYSPKN